MLWTKGKILGRGSFGTVYLAEGGSYSDDHLPSKMAVKSAAISESYSIQKEREILQKFEECPYIINCFGDHITLEDGEEFYNILLEFASGGTLADRVTKKPSAEKLDEYQVRRFTHSILQGLAYIHMHGYVHCDIKPHNILLVGDFSSTSSLIPPSKRVEEIAKIADFGLAKKVDGIGKKTTGQRGTPMYMAPELARQENIPASDIWSLGCTVLQMLTGKPPWKCGTEACNQLFRIFFTEDLPEIPTEGVSNVAVDFLNKCLVRDPESGWTADMLLQHPFVSSVKENGHLFNKRKLKEDIHHPEQRQAIASISASKTSFGLCTYQRYRGMKKNLVAHHSREAIPLLKL